MACGLKRRLKGAGQDGGARFPWRTTGRGKILSVPIKAIAAAQFTLGEWSDTDRDPMRARNGRGELSCRQQVPAAGSLTYPYGTRWV